MSEPNNPERNPRPAQVRSDRPLSSSRYRRAGLIVGVVTCLVSLTMGTLAGNLYWGSALVRGMVDRHGLSSLVNGVLHRQPDRDWMPDRQFVGRNSLNVLVLGVDYDYDNRNRIVKSAARSDSILIARLDFTYNRASALTIPRDTAVRIPGYRGIHKINAAHALGGPDLAMRTIKEVFGIPVDHYVVLNFEGFQKIVDAMGGIHVNVKKKLDYDDNWGKLHIHLKPGYQHLTGYEAMGYVRMRHSDSDFMRSQRQHEFLEAVRVKLRQPATFFRMPTVVNALDDSLQRSLTVDQLFTVLNFARKLPKENIEVVTLPSFEGPSYVTVNQSEAEDTIRRLFFPNQVASLSIDTPDMTGYRSSRGSSRRHRRSSRPVESSTREAPEPPSAPAGELTVEEPAPAAEPPSEPAPAPQPESPPAGGEGDGSGAAG